MKNIFLVWKTLLCPIHAISHQYKGEGILMFHMLVFRVKMSYINLPGDCAWRLPGSAPAQMLILTSVVLGTT